MWLLGQLWQWPEHGALTAGDLYQSRRNSFQNGGDSKNGMSDENQR